MKLYLITAKIDRSEDGTRPEKHAIWAGSQADAAAARKQLVEQGAKRKDLVTNEVEVPTKKEELIAFLNLLASGENIVVATEKLTK